MKAARRGVILPVVLMILLLLGLLGAMFAFRINADLASNQAGAYRLQTRLAAEAGIERVKLLLREARYDMNRWYNNLEELHRVVVWAAEGDRTVWGSNEEFDDRTMAYRFSIVADDPTDDEDFIRFGITDESAKLNLNTATGAQLLILVRAAVGTDPELDPQKIVDAVIDWRDPDAVPRGEKGGTEGEYYLALPKPYRVKNGPFDTVEELLLVKGVTGRILYGEDFDRNGLLTPNEDDGDESFPPDNEDGVLNRGLFPYLTVHSVENNVSNNNRARVFLFGPQAALRTELETVFPQEPHVVDYIVAATRSRGGTGGSGNRANRGGAGVAGRDGGENSDASDEPSEGNEFAGTNSGFGEETNDVVEATGAIQSPASLLLNRAISVQIGENPLTPGHLHLLLDLTTTVEERTLTGLININTAPRLVLKCIDGLTNEQIGAILETRGRLSSEVKETPAWLLTEEVVDLRTFERIAPQITARGQRFTIESLGYGDHIGMVTRLEVIIDMVGPIAQTIYYRDLSYLGAPYPIREEDLEKFRGRKSPS